MRGSVSLLFPILFPVAAGILIPFLPGLKKRAVRQWYVVLVLAVNGLAVMQMLWKGDLELTLFRLTAELPVTLHLDSLGRLFTGLVSAMWLLVGIFSFEYMKHEENESRFYCFYLITLGILCGLGLAGNYQTMYLFYEGMTLLTVPLVLHSGTKEAKKAGCKYLFYSIFGASLALLGFFFLIAYGTTTAFTPGGVLDMAKLAGHENWLLTAVFLTILGFGAKAGMFPLHAWLPEAHPAAPAPASAVLSGVITKAGVLAVIRVVFYLTGADFLRGTWVQYAWIVLALLTVFLGSMLAYKEKILKKRLAYSTVSQVSYILFGLSLLHPVGLLGALLHMIYHSVIKNTLFLSAGAVIYKTQKTKVDELTGIGKEMPVAMWCFTVASLGLIGIPPFCGYLSKWYLALGSLDSGLGALVWIGPAVLLASALLTAGYLFTITIKAFFPGEGFDYGNLKKREPNGYMTAPLLILTAAVVILGLFPNGLIQFLQTIVSAVL